MTTQNKENDSIRIGILKKYVGVQSWQMRQPDSSGAEEEPSQKRDRNGGKKKKINAGTR